MAEWVTIGSGALTAAINPLGAELSSLLDADGRELMTDADPAFWTGRAPLLFPIVGRLAGDRLRVDGQSYAMKQHGFARRMTFEVVSVEPARAVFALSDSAATRAQYPFAFRLEVAFAISEATLAIEVTVANPGAVDLPASFGFHPAFAWPLPYDRPSARHFINFETEESGFIRRLCPDGTLAPDPVPSPFVPTQISLEDRLFENDALILDAVRSQAVEYKAQGGWKWLRISFPDTPMLGIWSKPGAEFICIEPWHGLADPQGYGGEFRDKSGVFTVPPGGNKRIGMSVTLVG